MDRRESLKRIRTHYQNLQVTENASQEVIKGAYKYLSKKWHPDRHPNNRKKAESTMCIINEAFAVLSDPIRKQQHDEWIKENRKSTFETNNNREKNQNNDNFGDDKIRNELIEEIVAYEERWLRRFSFAIQLLVLLAPIILLIMFYGWIDKFDNKIISTIVAVISFTIIGVSYEVLDEFGFVSKLSNFINKYLLTTKSETKKKTTEMLFEYSGAIKEKKRRNKQTLNNLRFV